MEPWSSRSWLLTILIPILQLTGTESYGRRASLAGAEEDVGNTRYHPGQLLNCRLRAKLCPTDIPQEMLVLECRTSSLVRKQESELLVSLYCSLHDLFQGHDLSYLLRFLIARDRNNIISYFITSCECKLVSYSWKTLTGGEGASLVLKWCYVYKFIAVCFPLIKNRISCTSFLQTSRLQR